MILLKKIFLLSKSKLWLYGLVNGVAANIELLKLTESIKKLKTLIDVGSNKGQFMLLLEKLFPDIGMFSFEPIKEEMQIQKKLFSFKKKIIFYNFAIGKKNSRKNFYITKRKDSSSFYKFNKPNSSNQDYKIIEQREIKVFKLDTILFNKNLKKPIILKLDVQGYEMEVLKGSLKILKRINYILIEVSKSEIYKNQATEKQIINFLKKRNFFPLNSTKSTKINKTNFLQRDILFKRKDKF
jgi:FkbM family methyltransferase